MHNERGHRVYDPAEDEKENLTDEEAALYREWKQANAERFHRVVRKIIQAKKKSSTNSAAPAERTTKSAN